MGGVSSSVVRRFVDWSCCVRFCFDVKVSPDVTMSMVECRVCCPGDGSINGLTLWVSVAPASMVATRGTVVREMGCAGFVACLTSLTWLAVVTGRATVTAVTGRIAVPYCCCTSVSASASTAGSTALTGPAHSLVFDSVSI